MAPLAWLEYEQQDAKEDNGVIDIHKYLARVCYSSDFGKLKPEYLEPFFEKTKLFSQFLGEKRWFAGHKLTIVDFLA